jgi:DNA-binding PadR family transcriptional regulator
MRHDFAGFWARRDGGGGGHGRHQGLGGFLRGAVRGDDIAWRGLRAGRRVGSEDLQLIILALLAEKPAHGYEIIKALGERSSGFYSPSPGMVYPALTYLEEIGFASVEAAGTRKLYQITQAGRDHLEQSRDAVDTMLAQLKWVGDKMEQMRRAFLDEGEPHTVSANLREVRSRLRDALVEKRGASEEEQQRIAEILSRAADEIRGK